MIVFSGWGPVAPRILEGITGVRGHVAVAIIALVLTGGIAAAQNTVPAPSTTSPPAPPAARGRAADNADAQAAFQFLQKKMTIDVSLLGHPEAGLARIQAVDGDICSMRCGFHLAVSMHDVADLEFAFSIADIAMSTLKWEIDGNNRAFVNFSSAAGDAVFQARSRSRKADIFSFDQKPQSDWTKWSEWKKQDKISCRAKPDKGDLDRVLRALSVIAQACGARETPF
jgi:hypothetical protein